MQIPRDRKGWAMKRQRISELKEEPPNDDIKLISPRAHHALPRAVAAQQSIVEPNCCMEPSIKGDTLAQGAVNLPHQTISFPGLAGTAIIVCNPAYGGLVNGQVWSSWDASLRQ
eukprot:429718-Pelagomonas_calceolata.AAC.9